MPTPAGYRFFVDTLLVMKPLETEEQRALEGQLHPDNPQRVIQSASQLLSQLTHFAGVVVTNYLWRPILPKVVDLVAPGGLLIYETFARGNEAYGRPRNPDFLLRPGELIEAVRGRLTVIAYGQQTVAEPKPAVVQHIAARRPV